MTVTLASVAPRRNPKSSAAAELAEGYAARAGRLVACEQAVFTEEAALLSAAGRAVGRGAATLILCDAGGELVSSEGLAELIRVHRDGGTQRLVFGVGQADGWSQAALRAASRTISFGRITLPHELARVVLAEQIYRALTILAGHPYHCGH